MTKPILYLDMDGVVVDFPETIEEIDQYIREKCREWCVKNSKHHSDFKGLFATLKPMDGAIEAIEVLRIDFDILLLSSAPWNNIESWSHKRQWVGKHLPQIVKKLSRNERFRLRQSRLAEHSNVLRQVEN